MADERIFSSLGNKNSVPVVKLRVLSFVPLAMDQDYMLTLYWKVKVSQSKAKLKFFYFLPHQ